MPAMTLSINSSKLTDTHLLSVPFSEVAALSVYHIERYALFKTYKNGTASKGDAVAGYHNCYCFLIGKKEDYIDLIPILENLYYDIDEFLKPIKGVKIDYASHR